MAMMSYYTAKIYTFKMNTKELWKLINQVINKKKNSGSIIPYIMVDDIKVTNAHKIANEFGQFYSSLGKNLVSKIVPEQKSIDYFISQIPCVLNSIVLNPVTQLEIQKCTDSLPNKTSSKYDKVSNTLLKHLNKYISYPLFIIFLQSFDNGTFPTNMKEAEVVPLFKSKETDCVINHHPISLIMTISKVLEKLMYTRVYKFLDKHQLLYQNQYGFRSQRSCEHVTQELMSEILHSKENNKQCAAVFF